jgi:hypothetical protein
VNRELGDVTKHFASSINSGGFRGLPKPLMRSRHLLSLNELATSTFDKKAFEECCIKFSKLQRLFMMESLME